MGLGELLQPSTPGMAELMLWRLLSLQTWSTGDSCLLATAFAWLGCPRLLGDVALEAARLSRCSRRGRLGHRELLLAMKLVLLRELSKPPPGSSSCEPLSQGPAEMGRS